jgi:Ca2+-binding EF-hand superfamily protein
MTIRILCSFALLAAFSACQTTNSNPPDRFAAIDTNKDGKLSRDEISDNHVRTIYKARDTKGAGKMTQAEWDAPGAEGDAAAFQARDANGDGVVTLNEAIVYGRKHGVANEVMKNADTNKDGTIDRAEARALYAGAEGPAH